MKWMRVLATVVVVALVQTSVACAQVPAESDEVASVDSPRVGEVVVRVVAEGLEHPWAIAFLPDGRMLVTERPGRLRVVTVDGQVSEPVAGVPEVWARGQGGLLDVTLDPRFEENGLVYLSYSKPGPDGQAATAVGRGRWTGDRLEGFEDIFVQTPWHDRPAHFGSRIVFEDDETLFVALGERFQFDPAQDLSNHLGTVVRIRRDGSVPEDNPFVNQAGARSEIWSYGHRNIQAAAIDPATGELWVTEMGPKGGDELNRVVRGENYGWPVVSWGDHYDSREIPDPPARPEFHDAVKHWTPSLAPSGMIFYTGDVFEGWQGMAMIGGLAGQRVAIVDVEGDEVVAEEDVGLPGRIREVEQGPDGLIYLAKDDRDGEVWVMQPLRGDE